MKKAAETRTKTNYPPAVDVSKVGTYPALTKAGGGYVYDDVLEYRVWVHPERGGKDFGVGDYYYPFESYAVANAFSKKMKGAIEPCVLVLQRQWIDEPRPSVRKVKKGKRITEWRVSWLANAKRTPELIARLMQTQKAA
jgi:putative acetyltransferase